ncbi:MAG: Cro/Cl family transcriptional regulator [Dehalococcoidia bacterium]|nr:Cro/Cl family transcriptional regulator [Dehalococcoidia bacterium]
MIVNHISRLIGERRLNIRKVALGTGITYATMHDLYHDRTSRIDFKTLDRLCTFFEANTHEVFEWRPEDERDQ